MTRQRRTFLCDGQRPPVEAPSHAKQGKTASKVMQPGMAMSMGSSPRLMIVSDLDGTMVDHEDPENSSLLRFNALWGAEYSSNSLLVFSSGRSPTMYAELRRQKPLLTPGITILSVGTEIMYGDAMIPDRDWEQEMNKGWNRAVVVEETTKFPQLTLQAQSEQRPHKASFKVEKAHAPEIVRTLSERLRDRGLRVKLIYSGGQDLDVLPEEAGKGRALAYLLRKLNSEGRCPEKVLVCGDSGNDAELFAVNDVFGVIVGNAFEELTQWYLDNAKNNPKIFRATERCASAILQAIRHFDFQPYVSLRDVDLLDGIAAKTKVVIEREIVFHELLYERWLRGEVENCDEVFQYLKNPMAPDSTLITPWGVEDNLLHAVEILRPLHGIHRGNDFCVWVDRIRTTKVGHASWVVKFDKWQRTNGELNCRITTAVIQYQPNIPYGIVLGIHETWREGYAARLRFGWPPPDASGPPPQLAHLKNM